MVLSNTTAKNTYSGDGSTLGPYTVSFAYYDSNDIVVKVDGIIKTISTHYTVSNGATQDGHYTGGTITFTGGNAPASGASNIEITCDTDATQGLDLSSLTNLDPDSLEPVLDRLAMIARDAKQKAQDVSVDSITAAEAAAVAAISDELAAALAAQDAAEIAQDAAEVAQDGAEAAELNATAAETAAQVAQDLSEQWAQNPRNTAITGSPGEYSSKHHSLESQDWATKAEDSEVTTGFYSALHWARKAEDEKNAIENLVSGDIFAPSLKQSNFAAVAGEYALVDTITGAANITATLASSPVVGQLPYFFIPVGNWGTYNLILAPQGSNKIAGVTGNKTLSITKPIMLTYISAAYGYRIDEMNQVDNSRNDFIISLESGVPFSTSNVASTDTVYLVPAYGNTISLYDTNLGEWRSIQDTEKSGTLNNNTNTNQDIYAYLSSGSIALEFVNWTNNTTRATAVTLQDGVLCKSGDKTRRFVGTVRTNGVSGETHLNLDNSVLIDNLVDGCVLHGHPTGSQTTTSSTFAAFDTTVGEGRIEFVRALPFDMRARAQIRMRRSSGGSDAAYGRVGIAISATNTDNSQHHLDAWVSFEGAYPYADLAEMNYPAGYYYLQVTIMDINNNAGETTEFTGDSDTVPIMGGGVPGGDYGIMATISKSKGGVK